VITILLSLLAALWLGGGFVLQQHVAATAPIADILTPRLLLDLVRQPLWLLGIAVMVVGQLLGAAALGRGSLALVEPLLAANLLFALPLGALWMRRRISRSEWVGAVALIAGLSGFIASADPGHTPAVEVDWQSWVIAAGALAALAALLIWFAKRTDLTNEGTLLGIGAGLLFGLQDALTSRAVPLFEKGPVAGFTSWQPYAVLGVALCGLILGQSAFKAAPLAASLPGLTVAEPLAGVALGAGLFAEPLRLTSYAIAGELLSLAAAVIGIYRLAHSPVICRTDHEPPVAAGRR
jgi:drug/metabolite transporter (DMT)-like permease